MNLSAEWDTMIDENLRYEKMEELIDTILCINRADLKQLRNTLAHMQKNSGIVSTISDSLLEKSSSDEDKRLLIGMLPYVLLDKKYFPTNNLLVILGIYLKFSEKRSREEIIGMIIAEVIKKHSQEIKIFRKALEKIIGKKKKYKTTDFFWEWDKIIRET
jgi:hypothetical protein